MLAGLGLKAGMLVRLVGASSTNSEEDHMSIKRIWVTDLETCSHCTANPRNPRHFDGSEGGMTLYVI